MNIKWIAIKDQPIPLDEQGLLVSHPHGVEYIVWHERKWCYCYSNARAIGALASEITHWCKPEVAIGPNPGGYHGD